MAIRYISNADGKGWLIVRHNNNSTYPPLPQYLKVEHKKKENGRDYFKILEGKNINKEANVSLKSNNTSYLTTAPPPYTGPATIKFNITKGQLWYGSTGPVDATTDSNNPIPVGTYDLELPYETHSLGAAYQSQSKFSTTWFRVGHTGDRFLHPGSISAGCVTVTNVSSWTAIYQYLIKSRKGDNISVG